MLFKRKKPKRYWDFAYVNGFIETNKDRIQELVLGLFKSGTDCLILIKDGEVVQSVAGYQFMYNKAGDITYSSVDYPCMKIKYKDGSVEKIACYKDVNLIEDVSKGRRSLKRG